MMATNEPIQLSVGALLASADRYLIPRYQRNYAWGEGEISQLIQDIADYAEKKVPYYIGTLVVHKHPDSEGGKYETIDGQQRLTTLSLIAAHLRYEKVIDSEQFSSPVVSFQSRKKSEEVLQQMYDNPTRCDPSSTLTAGYKIITSDLKRRFEDDEKKKEDFVRYLMKQVQIFRVEVPHDTDLNHYFEISNSRGEQLEKHEVLKSRLMEVFDGAEDKEGDRAIRLCFEQIWEACANLQKYIQMGFSKASREGIFGKEWNEFLATDFDQLCLLNSAEANKNDHETEADRHDHKPSLADIIKSPVPAKASEPASEEQPDRFHSVVNFPNFLLHVLRLFNPSPSVEISLDDKHLIDVFEEHLTKGKDRATRRKNIKKFAFTLLRARFFFDQYIIKREFIGGGSKWSLRRMKCYSCDSHDYVNTFDKTDSSTNDPVTRRILMLQAAFHVSNPSMSYKHWLSAALNHLFHHEQVTSASFLCHLENTAKSFIFDRYLAPSDRSFSSITLKPEAMESLSFDTGEVKKRLRFNAIKNNFVFNFLDYLLWLGMCDKIRSIRVDDFEFTFRSSVEHHSPQHPDGGKPHLDGKELHSFGNLYLISHGKNSRLSNFKAEAKKIEFLQSGTIDSLKQQLMIKYDNWESPDVQKHEDEMMKLLETAHDARPPFSRLTT